MSFRVYGILLKDQNAYLMEGKRYVFFKDRKEAIKEGKRLALKKIKSKIMTIKIW